MIFVVIMQQFDHQHIIKLIGICSQRPPCMIIMELAKIGEVNFVVKFYKKNIVDYVLSASYIFTS